MSSEEPPITLTQIKEVVQKAKSTILKLVSANLRDLDKFLEDNTHLFTLLSVFIALAAYVSQVNQISLDNSEIGGFVITTLSIVVMVGSVILFKIIRFATRDERDFFDLRNFGILGFGGLFIPLFQIVFKAVWSATEPVSGVIAISGMLAGIFLGLFHVVALGDFAEVIASKTRFEQGTSITFLSFLSIFPLSYMTNSQYYLSEFNPEFISSGLIPWLSTAYTFYTVIAFLFAIITVSLIVLATVLGFIVGLSERALVILLKSRTIRQSLPKWTYAWIGSNEDQEAKS